tara:strand:+ start:756 stop:1418 length:663 start_codon:yes stop_codon:yes gene_type:complete
MENNQYKNRCINIGCGTHTVKGWINYDFNKFIFFTKLKPLIFILKRLDFIPKGYKVFIDKVINEDIRYCNAGKYIPEQDNSVNILYSSHMLEHLDDLETKAFLSESIRVLVDGGLIRIVVPDFEKIVQDYLVSNNPKTFIKDSCLVAEKPHNLLKKIQYLIQGHGWHFNMYNNKSLIKLIKSYGFRDVKILNPGETKIKNTQGLDLYAHSKNSIYLEAIK